MTLRRIAIPVVIALIVFGAQLLEPELAVRAAQQEPVRLPAGGAVPTDPIVTDCDSTMSRIDAEQLALPQSAGELLKLIVMCRDRAQALISEGQSGSVFLPAMMGKDVALALEGHANELAEARKREAVTAIRNVVLAAWRLDADGDIGNREMLSQSYDDFSAAVAAITRAYGVQ